MSIQIKFILLFTTLLLTGIGISSTISFKATEQAMVDSALTTMNQTNLEIIQKIDLFHKKAQSDLLMALEHPAFQNYFSLPESRTGNQFDQQGHIQLTPAQRTIKSQMDGWALSLQKRFQIVETCVIDQNGQEHSRVTFGQVANLEDFSSEEATAPFFKPTMQLNAGTVHIQYPYISPDAKKWVFAYTSPIVLTDGTKAGLLHYELPVTLLQDLIRKNNTNKNQTNDNSRYFILDPSGLMLADSQTEISLESQSNTTLVNPTIEPQLADYLPLATSINDTPRFKSLLQQMQQGQAGSGWFEDQHERYHMTFQPLPTFGWSLAHIRPHHALLQGKTSMTNIRITFVMTGVITLLSAAAIIWFMFRKITQPLQTLTHSAEKIANGNLDFSMRVAEDAKDELGILAHAFNQMLATLSTTTDSKEFTEHVLGAMVDGLLVVDMNSRIHRLNKAILELMEETEENLIGRHLDLLLTDAAFSAIMYRDLLSNRLFRSQETTFQTTDGREVPVSISSSLIQKGDEITGLVILVQDIRLRKQNEEQLHFLANFDLLTKLPNRNLLHERLNQTLARAPWRSTNIGIMQCALDRFKMINETLGHRAGDELLKETANRLQASVREGDTVARIGGDEFMILFMDMSKAEDILLLAQKIAHAISLPLMLSNGQEIFVTASIGITIYPENGSTTEELIRNAVIATNHAKAQGKNQFSFFSTEMNQKGAQRLAMENDLRRAIERNELEAHYQPRWDLQKNRIVGAEALVRWRRRGKTLVSPGEFLPLAEELRLMEEIDLWMLKESCQQSRKWRDAGCLPIRISINLSHHLFGRPDLVALIQETLKEAQLPPEALELELTEAIVMNDVTHAMTSLHAFKALQIHLAIDDFGTGYSSFAHLRRLPVHVLKIDRSFIREITTNKEDAAITHAIITMAHTLNLRTTAEGAEEQEQRDLLTKLGCDELQGYLISCPIPANELAEKFLQCPN